MSETNVPFPTFGPTGFVAPAETAILEGVQADWQSAFGGILNFTTSDGGITNSTPQGQITASETAIIGENNTLFLQYCAQVDPSFSSGRMQDGIARVYFLSRDPAEPSVITCSVSGAAPGSVPVGAIIRDGLGNNYNCTAAVSFPAGGGSATTTFQNNLTGPIAWQAGDATISRTVPGWDSCSIVSGVLGRNVETAQAFEQRRAQSVAANAVGTIPAIQGAVLGVANVLDAYVTDNASDSPVTVGGVTLNANALYVCAYGGEAQDVAMAIWTKKQPGGPYYTSGNTTVTVTDPSPDYATAPSYPVTFETAQPVAPYIVVQLINGAAVPSTALTQIQAALTAAFAGTDGGPRARIGATLLASRYYAGIASLGAWAQVVSVQIGIQGAAFSGMIAGTVLTVASAAGALAVGQYIFGTGITPGTFVSSLGTGTGGIGTYNLSQASSISIAQAMASATVGNDISININRVPTYLAANTMLVLI